MKKTVILFLSLLLTAYSYAQTPVSQNGQLKVVGTKLVNQNGYPIQLRGMSTHGIQWYEGCITDASLDTLTRDWGADILRVSMYIQEGGYETNPSYYTALVKKFVDKATARGLYALIDFHMLTPGDPNYNTSRAITFFTDIANTYKNNNNVLYEICNEPNGVSWASIKNYADQIIPVIRAIDNDAVICVGTRAWSSLGLSDGATSQEIINNPVNFPNIMYSFHFYAKSHQDYYINHLDWASDRLPIFVTEFGTQEASGDGPNDLVMGQRYLDLLRNKKISWTNWNYSDNPLSGAVWTSGTCSGNTWSTSRLKESGVFIRNNMRTADDFGGTPPPTGTNIALGKTVIVSSTETTSLVGANAVDGNGTTRWASAMYADPQWITVDLGSNYSISQIKINWEAAYAKDYLIQVSSDNTNWTTLKTVQGNTSVNNDHTGLSGTGRYVRIYGTARGTEYGYSIYELEVYGTSVSTPNIALNKAVTVSSVEEPGFEGNYAVDGNTSTRWSATMYADPQWITVNLGATYSISQVKIVWEAAYAKDYLVQVSSDNTNWTTLKTVQGNTSLNNDHTGLSGTGRYLRIYGTARGSEYGYSIYELQVFGIASAVSAALKTEQTITVYPVPAHDNVQVTIPEGNKQRSLISLSDINGKVHFSRSVTGNTYNINVSKFPAGLYFLQVLSGNKKFTKKIVKE